MKPLVRPFFVGYYLDPVLLTPSTVMEHFIHVLYKAFLVEFERFMPIIGSFIGQGPVDDGFIHQIEKRWWRIIES